MRPRISGFGDNHQGGDEGSVSLVTLCNFHLFIQWLISAIAIEGKSKTSPSLNRYIGQESPD
jgi:hypothetical protein